MRRAVLPLLLVAMIGGSAAAATVHGTARSEVLEGTPVADRIDAGAGNDRVDVAFGGTDRVVCGPGSDLVVADRGDSVAPDCETVVRRISADPFRNRPGQHETAVEPDDAAWGETVVATFQLGRFRDAGANGIGVAVSHDAGQTWNTGVLPRLTAASSPPGTEARVSDPAVAYDALHATWLVTTLGITRQTAVLVSRSTDGRNWSAPVSAATGRSLDKEWIACDNGSASPFLGRCYLVYADDTSNRTLLQTSTDGGLTWSATTRVGDALLGAQPLIRPDGSLVVVAADVPDQGTHGAIVAFRSDDGGATFSGATVARIAWHDPQGMRAAPIPSAAAGPDGAVYAAWQQCATGLTCAANDIVLARSVDGSTWTSPLLVTHGGTDHFVTGLDADPARPGGLGLVYAVFQRGSCARGLCRVGVAFTSSGDGGDTWRTPRRLDARPFPETWLPDSKGRMVGDYYSTAFAGGRSVAVFALAERPLNGRLREGIFAASLPTG